MRWLKEKLWSLGKGFLTKTLLNKHLKAFLDKLPLNGKKTYLGFALVVIGAIINALGEGTPNMDLILILRDFILSYDVQVVTDPTVIAAIYSIVGGLITAAVGLYHKLLKKVVKEDNHTAVENLGKDN